MALYKVYLSVLNRVKYTNCCEHFRIVLDVLHFRFEYAEYMLYLGFYCTNADTVCVVTVQFLF